MQRFFLLLFLCWAFAAEGQNFGGFPLATSWQQINSDTARIIFTPPAAAQAMRIAQLVHAMANDTPVAIGRPLHKINIVLHQQTTQANGYVALGPFRSEFYLIPGADPFEFGTLPWHENLAVHEYRHVQQYNAFDRGLTRIFKFFGGQNGRALANALTIPDWFFEGDAVYAETAFTGLGRGRQPYFLSAFNSLWQDGKTYSWMKLRNGSYKDFVPNHYQLGYLLVNYGYQKYGTGFWQNVTKDASGFRFGLYPFQKAVARYGHGDFKKFRTEALSFYKQTIPVEKPVSKNKQVTNYYFPQPVGPDSLLYVKESYRTLPAFYVRDRRGEHFIKRRAITTENWFHCANGKVVYTGFNTDSRWSLTDYSDIFLLNVRTKKEKQLTHKSRYYTPALSADGSQLLAISINDSLQTELHLLNVQNGAVIKRIRSRNGDYFMQPAWLNTEIIVLSIRTPQGLLSLQTVNIRTGATSVLIPPQKATIGNPFIAKNLLLVSASLAGNDDIYAYKFDAKKLYRLTNGKTGNYNPALVGDSLVWVAYTSSGLQMQQKALADMDWSEVILPDAVALSASYPVAFASENILTTPPRTFAITTYGKSTGLINVHSWDPGLNIYSNNILNTLAANTYYRYNEAEKSHTTGISATYGGFYPQLIARFENVLNRHIRLQDSTVIAAQQEASIGYSISLNFTRGRTSKGLRFGSSYVLNNLRAAGTSKGDFLPLRSQYLSHVVGWTQQLPRARQHIFPKLGYAATLQFRHRIDGKGYQAFTNVAAYLPGLFANHSIVLAGSFQQVDSNNRIFSNRFSVARGYPDYYYSRMWNAGFNYHLPLAYPDWGVGNLVYFLRVRANVFFDYAKVFTKDRATTAALRSTGTEVYFDTKWWNQLPVSFGVRYSYLLDKRFASGKRQVVELILPLNLLPF